MIFIAGNAEAADSHIWHRGGCSMVTNALALLGEQAVPRLRGTVGTVAAPDSSGEFQLPTAKESAVQLPQTPGSLPCTASPISCLSFEKPSLSPHCGRVAAMAERILEHFSHRVSVPRRPCLPLLLASPPASSSQEPCCAGKWELVYGLAQHW